MLTQQIVLKYFNISWTKQSCADDNDDNDDDDNGVPIPGTFLL